MSNITKTGISQNPGVTREIVPAIKMAKRHFWTNADYKTVQKVLCSIVFTILRCTYEEIKAEIFKFL